MASKTHIFGFVIILIGVIMAFYLSFMFLSMTILGYFNFIPIFGQIGILVSMIVILLSFTLLSFCIFGFVIKKLAKSFGIVLVCISSLMYGLIMFFTFYALSASMPVELWPTMVLGSDGFCLIIVGGILYIISKEN